MEKIVDAICEIKKIVKHKNLILIEWQAGEGIPGMHMIRRRGLRVILKYI